MRYREEFHEWELTMGELQQLPYWAKVSQLGTINRESYSNAGPYRRFYIKKRGLVDPEKYVSVVLTKDQVSQSKDVEKLFIYWKLLM